jgi:signal transduction histidine kinase
MNADNARLITLVGGSLFILLSLATWSLLRVPQHATTVRLWTAGALLLGLGFLGSSFRAQMPDWFGGLLLNGLALGSQWLRVLALRRYMDLPLHALRGLGLLLATLAVLAALSLGDDPRPRVTVACAGLAALSLSLAWHARLAGRRSGSRSARLLALSELPLAGMLLVRGGLVWLTLPALVARPVQVGSDWLLLLAVVVVAGIYSNLAYLGLLLDDTRHDEGQARAVQAAETRARQVAEAHAQALEALLQERDRLARERQRTLDLLAHEIRQPLHDAGGALQAAASALQDLPPALSGWPSPPSSTTWAASSTRASTRPPTTAPSAGRRRPASLPGLRDRQRGAA